MNPDQIAAQQRQQALTLADKRSDPGSTIDQVLATAEKLLAFLQGGLTIATPSQSTGG